jgi:hypothetical protein
MLGSDHNLLKIKFKVKLRVKTEMKYNEKRRIANIFQNSKWKKECAVELSNTFEVLENMEDDKIENNINENGKTLQPHLRKQNIS